MKRFLLLAGAASLLVFSSCHKDKDKPAETTRLLKKMIQTEDGEDPIVYNFNYDAAKRLTTIKSADNTEIQSFSYDPAGKLTGIVVEEEGGKYVYHFAYSNGIPVSAELKLWSKFPDEPDLLMGERQYSYTIANNRVSKIHVNFGGSGIDDYDLSYDSRGNLIKTQRTNGSDYKETYTYGTKKAAFPIVSNYVLEFSTSLFGFSPNEIVTARIEVPPTYDVTFTTEYTYDANDYVLASNDGNVKRTFEYE